MLDPVPRSPFANGKPAFGTYRGRSPNTQLNDLKNGGSRIRRFFDEKAWQWFAAVDSRWVVGGAVVDAGLLGTGFCWVFDREQSRMVAEDDVVVPSPLVFVTSHPIVGTLARIDRPGYRLAIERQRETLTIDARFGDVELTLEGAPSDDRAITAICPVAQRPGGVNITQKEANVDFSGTVATAGETALGPSPVDAVGFLDYTHGILGRETAWRWALGRCQREDGSVVSFNLVDGFNAGLENVIWADDCPDSVGEASVLPADEDGVSDSDWRVRTDCDTVDLTLTVDGTRRHELSIGPIESRYRQPVGTWRGRIGDAEVMGYGVAETHLTRW